MKKNKQIGLTVIFNHLKANVICALSRSLVLLAVIIYYLLKILPVLIFMKTHNILPTVSDTPPENLPVSFIRKNPPCNAKLEYGYVC
jgi:hypothetical protein